jgi:hypothetical protein
MAALSLYPHWVLLSKFGFGYGKAAQLALKLMGRQRPKNQRAFQKKKALSKAKTQAPQLSSFVGRLAISRT